WGTVQPSAPQPASVDGRDLLLQLTAGDAPASVAQPLAGVLVIKGGNAPAKAYAINMPDPSLAPVEAAAAGSGAAPGASPAAMNATGATGTDASGSVAPSSGSQALAAEPGLGLGYALLLAVLGGLVLNLMPCVFPVLSIKALALMRHADHTPRQARL